MARNNYYELIVAAKENVAKIVDEIYYPEDVVSAIKDFVRTNKYTDKINNKAAIATVLWVGSFYNDQFMMPSTKDCLSFFKTTRKRISDGKKLEVLSDCEYKREWLAI